MRPINHRLFDQYSLSESQLLSLLNILLPSGKRFRYEYCAINPKRHDTTIGSFRYNIRKNVWADFACADAKGQGIVSLYQGEMVNR